jgi:hypothetical protein
MEQGWYTPPTAPQEDALLPYAPAPQPTAAPNMRPLSLGEILDRTFSVYRSRFWLFAGIGAVSAALLALMNAVQLLPMHMASRVGGLGTTPNAVGVRSPLSPNYLAGLGVGFLLVLLLLVAVYLFVYVVTQAATVYALQEVYMGRETTIAESIRSTIGRWYRYLGIGIWQFFSLMWIPLAAVILGGALMLVSQVLGGVIIVLGALAGFVGGFILYLRNVLGVQAAVVESLTVRTAMRRSKVLMQGAKGRTFVLLLLAGVLNYVASLLQLPLLFFITFTLAKGGQAIGAEIAMLVVSFVARAAVQPVAMIGLSLIYFDQRVRQEAFDLLLMLGPEPTQAFPPAAEPLRAAAMPSMQYAEPIVSPVVEPASGVGSDGPIENV